MNIRPEWIEIEAPDLQKPSLRQAIANSFYEFGRQQGCFFLPSIAGLLSTTFHHPVFAMPHLDSSLGVHGFHTAFRPTDMDEGTHLVAFGQYYICTNKPFINQFELIQTTLLNIVLSSFPADLGLTDIKLEEGCYEWQADSTGYKGGGGEVNVTAVTIDGKEHKIGRLELAQINDYAISGNICGKPCHLIVFGIDRLVSLLAIIRAIKEGRTDFANSVSFEYLYSMEQQEAAAHKGLIDAFRSLPADTSALLASIHAEFNNLRRNLDRNEFNDDVFSRLGHLSSLTECAYASNAVTRNYRQHLIRKLGQMYARFAKDIATSPQQHMQLIKRVAASGAMGEIKAPSIYDVVELQYFKSHFKLVPRTFERPIHTNLIPESLIEFFKDEELIGGIKLPSLGFLEMKEQHHHHAAHLGVQKAFETSIRQEQRRIFHEICPEPDRLPQFQIKQQMFFRVVGEDLAQPVEALAHPTQNILTLAGSVSDRISRISVLLDFLEHEGILKDTDTDCAALKEELRYLGVEWQYRSVKIYPQLEGGISSIAMRQQGYNAILVERMEAFHLAGTKRQNTSCNLQTALLILVGKLDEAVSLYVRSLEDGRSISSLDPFGVKTKIAVAVDAAKTLGLGLTDVRNLLVQITKINPDALGDEPAILDGYFWTRIKKAFDNHQTQSDSK